MKWIRILKNLAHNGGSYDVGTICQRSIEEADDWIRAGLAEATEAPTLGSRETMARNHNPTRR